MADMFLSLWDRFEEMEAKVASLKKNNRNSSKPPSSDQHNLDLSLILTKDFAVKISPNYPEVPPTTLNFSPQIG
jgi:hypothetical protein